MQNIYSAPYKIKPRSTVKISTRFFSFFLAVTGGLVLGAACFRFIEVKASGWSPTETARRCFNYPDEPFIPDRQDITQTLLSAAFFGSDALYFDDGEENTGVKELENPEPSRVLDEELPETPLGELNTPYADNTNIYSYDRSLLPEGDTALLPYDLSGNASPGEVLLSNTTEYSIEPENYLNLDYPIQTTLSNLRQDEPLILIIHTHGTESYSPENAASSPPNAVQRSSDRENNVVAVGAVMADMLNKSGIPTIHCEIMHDLESYTRSYNLAADTIQRYLSEYPSIKYVFDVHRDAIVRTNGDLIRPLTVINGERTAQIMLLVGTNEKGADHPEWESNFTVAAKLQSKMTAAYPRFARPINIRGASFNEQFTPGSLLIEIGSAANSLSEAKNAAKYLTYSLIDLIKENAVK